MSLARVKRRFQTLAMRGAVAITVTLVSIPSMAANVYVDNNLFTDANGNPVAVEWQYNSTTNQLRIITGGDNKIAPVDGNEPAPQPAEPFINLVVVENNFVRDVPSIDWQEGSRIEFRWTGEDVSCSFQGGNAGWRVGTPTIPGSRSVTVDFTSATRFTLQCVTSASVAVSDSILVTPVAAQEPVEPPVGADTCTKSPDQIPLWTGRSIARSWNSFWVPETWPQPVSTKRTIDIPKNGYASLYFDTGSVSDTGGIIPISLSSTDGRRLISISPCEGDFAPADNRCVISASDNEGLGWTTSGSNVFACPLAPDTRYYLNMTYTDGVTPDGKCGLCDIYLYAANSSKRN